MNTPSSKYRISIYLMALAGALLAALFAYEFMYRYPIRDAARLLWSARGLSVRQSVKARESSSQ